MNGGGWTVFSAVFVVVLLALSGGYFVHRTYSPPASATPVTPEVRQFGLYLHVFEAGEGTVHHWFPSVIVVNVGDTAILRITNTDQKNSHGFSLGALNVTVASIAPGDTVTVRFQATRPGVYHYGCSLVGCAADHMQQTGQFIVLSGR